MLRDGSECVFGATQDSYSNYSNASYSYSYSSPKDSYSFNLFVALPEYTQLKSRRIHYFWISLLNSFYWLHTHLGTYSYSNSNLLKLWVQSCTKFVGSKDTLFGITQWVASQNVTTYGLTVSLLQIKFKITGFWKIVRQTCSVQTNLLQARWFIMFGPNANLSNKMPDSCVIEGLIDAVCLSRKHSSPRGSNLRSESRCCQ